MLHKLLTLPFKAVLLVGQKINEEVEFELYDLRRIQTELLQLHLAFERGELTEPIYRQREGALLERYQIAKERERASGDW